MVCAVGLCTSINRWCVRVSKCSRLSVPSAAQGAVHGRGDARLRRLGRLDDLIARVMHVVRLKRAKTDANLGRLHGSLRQGAEKPIRLSQSQSLRVQSPHARASPVGFPDAARVHLGARPARSNVKIIPIARVEASRPRAPRARCATSRAPSPPSRPGSRQTNESARARTACAVVARGLVCGTNGK